VVGVPIEEEFGSWRKGKSFPETAAAEVDEGGAMARSDLEPEDLMAVISVLEYAITNFRYSFHNPARSYPIQKLALRHRDYNGASTVLDGPAYSRNNKLVRGRERFYFKSHITVWEHYSHFRLIGRGVPSVSAVSQLVYKILCLASPKENPRGP